MLLKSHHMVDLVHHLDRHMGENGQDGFFFCVPVELSQTLEQYQAEGWKTPPPIAGWQRVWGWWDPTGELRAHCVLTGSLGALHRCTLAMGVEEPFRRLGIGRALQQTALEWVITQPGVDWVDGWAFGHNEPVLALDHAMGFVDVGRMQDVVRVLGQSFEQVFMTIDLRRGGRPWQQAQQ